MRIPELAWPVAQKAYDDDLLLGVQSGTTTLLVRGRNAWNATWVRHFLKDATLYTDSDSAELGAEAQRGPGNVFYVVDAPAILLRGRLSTVVLCDAHPDNPFGSFTGVGGRVTGGAYGGWIDGLFPGVSVRDAVHAFRHDSGHWAGPAPSEHSLRTGRLDSADMFVTKTRPLQSLVSRPVGSNRLLEWDPHPQGTRYTRRGANAVSKGWTDLLANTMGCGREGPINSEALRRYRDEVLGRLPKSQWLEKRARDLAEEAARRQQAFERWVDASDRASELDDAVWDASAERRAAQEARMKPASTSAGVRAQRERYEAAVSEEDRLIEAHSHAEAEADELWKTYIRS